MVHDSVECQQRSSVNFNLDPVCDESRAFESFRISGNIGSHHAPEAVKV